MGVSSPFVRCICDRCKEAEMELRLPSAVDWREGDQWIHDALAREGWTVRDTGLSFHPDNGIFCPKCSA